MAVKETKRWARSLLQVLTGAAREADIIQAYPANDAAHI